MDIPDSSFRVVDLSQNLGFANITSGKMPCITPDGLKFLTRNVRYVTGAESLRYQGIWLDVNRLQKYTSSFLQDLAGNAYETSCCTASMLCAVVFMARNFLCRVKQQSMCKPVENQHDDSDQEDDSL